MARILRLIFGYLVIRIRGSAKERFLNLCIAKGMEGFSASCEEDSIVATIRLKDFYQLRPFVRKTKVKVVILKRIGLPFLIPKLKKRPFFILGALLALIVWIFMGSFLGKIEIWKGIK